MRYVFLLLLIGASIGFFVAIVKPRYNDAQAARDDIATYEQSLVTAAKLKEQREALIAKYNNIPAADLENLKTLLPDSVDNIRLIIQLNSLATTNGLATLRNVNYVTEGSQGSQGAGSGVGGENNATSTGLPGINPATARRGYRELTISFDTTGQYGNFLNFLSALEQNLRIVDVKKIQFNTTDSNAVVGGVGLGVVGNLTYRVTLTTYWLKQ